jgi:hypothetical protein
MKNAINSLIINFFLSSNEFEFRDFDMNNTMDELQPLLISTIKNYLYLKKTNPTDIPYKNVNFISEKK